MKRTPPKIENAPGHVWRGLANGRWVLRWQADSVLVKRGFEPSGARIWAGTEADLKPAAIKYIQDECNRLQTQMRVWGRGGVPIESDFDGTLRGLINCYQTDKFSSYQKIVHQTRENYNTCCARLMREKGATRIEEIDGRVVTEWHAGWEANGQRITLAHSMITMLRVLFSYGSALLKDVEGKKACKVVRDELGELRFSMGKPRTSELTPEQAVLIRNEARRRGWDSIALAQAFQTDCLFRQKDCIGEWVPMAEPVMSTLVDGNRKWARGIKWEEIDENLTLRHVTSKRQKELTINLTLAPFVMEELRLAYGENFTRADLPSSGPIVTSEATSLPFSTMMFRRRWRQCAKACGIPNNIRNMDSRAGGIRESFRAGVRPDAIKKSATHSNFSMTERYNRGEAEDIAEAMKTRAEYRANKTGTSDPRTE